MDASLNSQSQVSDIPGVSSRTAYPLSPYMLELLASFNAQANASDIHLLSLREYMQDLLASFNAQEQAPDGIHAQDRQWAPCLFVENFRHCSQEPARLPTKQDTPHLSRQQVSQVSAQELQFEHVLILTYLGVS